MRTYTMTFLDDDDKAIGSVEISAPDFWEANVKGIEILHFASKASEFNIPWPDEPELGD